MTYDQTLNAMKALAERSNALVTGGYPRYGHPIDLNFSLEYRYLSMRCFEYGAICAFPESLSQLCTLVTASAFDYSPARRLRQNPRAQCVSRHAALICWRSF